MILDWVGPLLFTKSEIRRVPEGVCGVYLLHVCAPAYGGYPVVYAGKATNLRQRLGQHAGDQAKPIIQAVGRMDQIYFSAAPVPLTLLDHIEAGLVHNLDPLCNDQRPAADPITVNLPPITFDFREE